MQVRAVLRPLVVALAAATLIIAGGAPQVGAAESADATVYLVQGVQASMRLSVDGKVVASSAAAKTIVGPLTLPAGSHVVAAEPLSGSVQGVRSTVSLSPGSSTDVVVHLSEDPDKAPVITAFENDLSPVTKGSARLTVAHTAAVGPADILVDGKVLFSNVASAESLTLTVPSGTYTVEIVPTGAFGNVIFGPAKVPVTADALNRVFAIGVAETSNMDAVVQVLPLGQRGSAAPHAVNAGDGGQAQPLIAASATSTVGDTAAGRWTVAGLGVLATMVTGLLILLRRRPATPGASRR